MTSETLERGWRAAEKTRRLGTKPGKDPVALVRAIAFTSFIRSPKYFTEALDEAENYLALDVEDFSRRDSTRDPSRSALCNALATADVVCCLLHRRCFEAWFQEDVIKCICLYSDASPVVGTEIQGMVVDVMFRDGAFERIILPGSTIAYDAAYTIGKGIALLWAIFLVAGPSTRSLTTFCEHVSSFTTEFGVEMHLLEMPTVVNAFVEWASGRPFQALRPLVNQDTRFFHRVLRMAGWSHTFGGIMKEVANSMRDWPANLKHMRELCRLFKNKTHRRHIYSKLHGVGKGPANLSALMSKFSAGFVKWRYEIVPEVQRQLLPLREFCEEHLDFALFRQSKDTEEIRASMHACRDKEFWKWMASTNLWVFTAF